MTNHLHNLGLIATGTAAGLFLLGLVALVALVAVPLLFVMFVSAARGPALRGGSANRFDASARDRRAGLDGTVIEGEWTVLDPRPNEG